MAALARFQRTLTDTTGNVRDGVSVTIRDESSGAVAPLYSDKAGTVAIVNPVTTDSNGFFAFYVAPGRYRIQATGIDWRDEDLVTVEGLQDAVDEAEAARDAAQDARDAAQLSSGIFADTTAGLAGTSEGDYFSTPSGDNTQYLILYRHDSGPVATEIERYPSIRGTVIWKETLADLKAIPLAQVADKQAAKITTTGRAGDFTWLAGDQSANVSSDPLEGIYIAPDADSSGTSGAFMRNYNRWSSLSPEWFGALRDGVSDDSAAIQATLDKAEAGSGTSVSLQDGTYRLDAGIVPKCSLIGAGRDRTVIDFYGTGIAVDFSGSNLEVGGYTLQSKASSQDGLRIRGGISSSVRKIFIKDFDGTSFAIGEKGVVGAYFLDVDGIEIRNDASTTGSKGLYIAGLSLPNSNANVLKSVFISGPFDQYMHIEGNNNTFINCDANPDEDNVSGGIQYVFNVEGHLNVFTNTYIEPSGASYPNTIFRFSSVANSNSFNDTYLASYFGNTDSTINDEGTGNSVEVRPIGFNFPQSSGKETALDNLRPNSNFYTLKSDGLPQGWVTTGTGTVTRDTGTTRGSPYSMKLEVSASAVTLQATVATSSPGAPTALPLQTYPAGLFQDKTITVGVWCWSSQEGLGAIKVNAGGSTVGAEFHSGSSSWEFLTTQVRATSSTTEVSVQLRTSRDNVPLTGSCYFSQPVLCIGGDVPKNGG
ncbi:MAG: glycosyl hydrolase family 28-related protein, partial [Spongiibacter sp.]|nr:glycosyl hydrolase family 28-related protein [Spongiibacter sp.]